MYKAFQTKLPKINSHIYSLEQFHGIGDGIKDNTQAFQNAIAEVGKTGGRLLIPNGIWRTGPIEMKSGVELHLEDNAVITFSKSQEQYPLIITDYEGIRRIRTTSPIWAENAHDIAITGKGTIEGNGHLWRPVKEFKMTKREWHHLLEQSPYVIDSNEGGVWVPTKSIFEGRKHGEIFPKLVEHRSFIKDDDEKMFQLIAQKQQDDEAIKNAMPFYDFYRPVLVSFRYCERILIEGVTLQNSPAWNIHPYFCEDLTIRDASIYNPYYAQNGDGIDVDSCNRVHIHHSRFQVGDDGICIKAGKDREARALIKPSQNIHIHDCYVGYSHGGFVIGSEMSRGVKNVLVEDCTFINSDVGVNFKSACGRGGVVEDIYIRRINMVHIKKEAFVMTMDYVHNLMDYHDPVAKVESDEDIPIFKNVFIEYCTCIGGAQSVKIIGMEQKKREEEATIHHIYFQKCGFQCEKGAEVSFAANVIFKDCQEIPS